MQQTWPFCYTPGHDDHPSTQATPSRREHQKGRFTTISRGQRFHAPGVPGSPRSERPDRGRAQSPGQALILEQWGAGHRVSEALALEPLDLRLDTDQPTLRIREGKGRKSREVLLHPKLQAAPQSPHHLQYVVVQAPPCSSRTPATSNQSSRSLSIVGVAYQVGGKELESPSRQRKSGRRAHHRFIPKLADHLQHATSVQNRPVLGSTICVGRHN